MTDVRRPQAGEIDFSLAQDPIAAEAEVDAFFQRFDDDVDHQFNLINFGLILNQLEWEFFGQQPGETSKRVRTPSLLILHLSVRLQKNGVLAVRFGSHEKPKK